MSDFRQLSDEVWASPQIEVADVADAAARGFGLIVNNRPDGEAADQPSGESVALAASEAGIDYIAIPITHSGFSAPQVEAMVEALRGAQGKVLAYCRSGTRSTLLWALAQASQGASPVELAASAAQAGYDLGPVRPALESLAARNS